MKKKYLYKKLILFLFILILIFFYLESEKPQILKTFSNFYIILIFIFTIFITDIVNLEIIIPKIIKCPNCNGETEVADMSFFGTVFYCAKCEKYYGFYRKKDLNSEHLNYTWGIIIALSVLYVYEFFLMFFIFSIISFFIISKDLAHLILLGYGLSMFLCIIPAFLGVIVIFMKRKLSEIIFASLTLILLIFSYKMLLDIWTVETNLMTLFLIGAALYILCLYPAYNFIVWINKKFKTPVE